MARTKISEFSATAADNTDIDNINIAEGCAPSGINNAIRELMAQLKDMQTGASGDTFTLTTVNSTTVDTTNLEATNLKAKDGTAAGSIADSTGVVTLASSVLTTTDINGGTVDGTTIGASTPSTVVATQVDIVAQGDLRLQDTTGGQYVALQAPSTVATSYTLTLPVDDGTSGQALITDGSGVLSWSSAASGDVYGPASATDNAVARYDGTTGKIIQNSAVTIADDGATVIAANSTSDGLRITQTGTGNALVVEDSANPDASPGFVVDANGDVFSGALPSAVAAGLSVGAVNVIGNNTFRNTKLIRVTDNTSPPQLLFTKARGTSVTTPTIVASGDLAGSLVFQGYDGAGAITAAQINGEVDGTPGTNDMPGRLLFSTTADGASSPTERMRIDNQGRVGIGSSSSVGTNFTVSKNITGATTAISMGNFGQIQSDVTTEARYFTTAPSTAATAFTLSDLRHYVAFQGAFGAGSAVTNQAAFYVGANLTGATNNYGFYGDIASGTGRWNFYAAGTAANYFAGNVGIGTTTMGGVLNLATGSTTDIVAALGGTFPAFTYRNGTGAWFHAGKHPSSDYFYIGNGGTPTTTINMAVASSGAISLGAAPGAESLRVTPVASAVNYLQVAGGATGGTPALSAQGSDTNVGLFYITRGTSPHSFLNAAGATQFQVAVTASAVNYLQATGGATGAAATLSAQGSDTNIDIALTPQGTGVVTTNSGLSVTKTAVTAPAATDGNVFSGTYTPTLTNSTNIDASTAFVCQYMRVGSVVTVSGAVSIDATTTATDTVLRVSLPIASNVSSSVQIGGAFAPNTGGNIAGAVYGDAANDVAIFRITVATAASQGYAFSFTYQVI